MTTEFARQLNPHPATDEVREAVLQNPGFGKFFTDHMVCIDWQGDVQQGTGRWDNARLQPYGPISLDPSTSVLHYGQEIFEGLKAYRHGDGSVWSFRPEANAARLNRSAQRLALPTLPEETFVDAVRELVTQDQAWVPSGDGESLYLRPFMIATEPFLGVRPSKEALFSVIASPAGNYFGTVEPVDIWLSGTYARAGKGGTGAAKCGGNYAASLIAQMEGDAHGCSQVLFLDEERGGAVEELGGMNVFFVHADGRLVTPALTGTILEGVTRSSILQLGRDMGLTVEERRVTLAEWAEGVRSGEITEVFACGTAAVVTPIGRLLDGDDVIESAGGTDVTLKIRAELEGIQTGRVEDRHGWLHRLV